MKKWATLLLIRLLNPIVIPSYRGIENKEKIDEWLRELWANNNFQSYLRYRDLQILKTLGTGLDDKTYWIYLGRRAELQDLAGRSKELFDKYAKEKKANREESKDDSS